MINKKIIIKNKVPIGLVYRVGQFLLVKKLICYCLLLELLMRLNYKNTTEYMLNCLNLSRDILNILIDIFQFRE